MNARGIRFLPHERSFLANEWSRDVTGPFAGLNRTLTGPVRPFMEFLSTVPRALVTVQAGSTVLVLFARRGVMTTARWFRTLSGSLGLLWCLVAQVPAARAQGLGGAGTIQGTVKDPTGGVMVAVPVELRSPVSGFKRSTTTDPAGKIAFRNLPPNNLHLDIVPQGFIPIDPN